MAFTSGNSVITYLNMNACFRELIGNVNMPIEHEN